MRSAGRIVQYPGDNPVPLLASIDQHCNADVRTQSPVPGLRCRHVIKDGDDYYLLFNEQANRVKTAIEVAAKGKRCWIATTTGKRSPRGDPLQIDLDGYELALLQCCR
jgi:hypothetical protein